MAVITIRGQLGSGADEVGRAIASQLHYEYVDREIIARVARKLKMSRREVSQKEMPPSSLLGRIAEVMASSYSVNPASPDVSLPVWQIPLNDARYLETLERVIKDIASGGYLVIRGRGSQFILKDLPGAFHILTVAPPELRLRRVMQDTRLDAEAARKEMERIDSSRRAFIKRYFKAELEDPVHYDLVINTGRFSFETAASLVSRALDLLS